MDVKDISHFKTNFEGVKNIISASNAVDSVVKIVFTSSLLVCEGLILQKMMLILNPILFTVKAKF